MWVVFIVYEQVDDAKQQFYEYIDYHGRFDKITRIIMRVRLRS